MARREIIIDCDPGHDDALAILLALGSAEELEVLAITAVAGNVPLALTAANARAVVELAGRRDLPVHAGCARPLVRELVTAEYIHGRTGLDGAELPAPTLPLAEAHAVDALIELVRARPPGSVTLCTLGPLTNLALALLKAPDLAPRLKEIVLMGGAIGEGNITPAAEFNIYVDPHAAKLVFAAGVPLTMFGLDVTHQALVTPARLAAIRALRTPLAAAVGACSRSTTSTTRPAAAARARRCTTPARSPGCCGPSCSPAAPATSRSRPGASTRSAAPWSTGRVASSCPPTPW